MPLRPPDRKPARRRAKRRNPLHTRVRDLPASLQAALRDVGYGKAAIELRGSDQGVTGREHPVYATITVHPSNLTTMLQAPVELSPQAQLALDIVGGYTSKGRIDEFEYRKLGKYGPANPLVQELAAKGLVKITASGVQVTTEGKSARRRNPRGIRRANPDLAGARREAGQMARDFGRSIGIWRTLEGDYRAVQPGSRVPSMWRKIEDQPRSNPAAASRSRNPSLSAEQASTLLRQLGGQARLVAMIGAKDFIRNVEEDGTPSLSFKFKGSPKANYARIALEGDDTYALKLFRIRGYDAVPVREVSGLYADGLRSVFEQATGLYLSLGTMRNPGARCNPVLPGPEALAGLAPGDRIRVTTDTSRGRSIPYTIISKKFDTVKAENMTNGARVVLTEDDGERGTLVIFGEAGAPP